MKGLVWAMAAGAVTLAACSERADAGSPTPTAQTTQRGEGAPYEILGTQVWDVPDPVSGRDY